MARRELNPDQLAALEDQQEHLLQSLDDLDAEHRAGDIDEADYATLRDDYTARAAAVIRAIDTHETAVAASKPKRSTGRTFAWVCAVAIFGVLAGYGVKQASGTRGVNESGSGEIRENTRQLLFEASAAGGRGDFQGAIERYSEALEVQPGNVEAYTYRGWVQYQQGDVEAAVSDLTTAIDLDPDASAPRVFRAAVSLNEGNPQAAAADLLAFARSEPDAQEQQLVRQFRLRERTADALAEFGEPLEALMFLDELWAEGEDDPDIAAHRGWLVALTGTDELLASGEQWQDRALALDPTHPPALVYRGLIRAQVGNADGATEDLAAYEAGGIYPEFLQSLLAAIGPPGSAETDEN